MKALQIMVRVSLGLNSQSQASHFSTDQTIFLFGVYHFKLSFVHLHMYIYHRKHTVLFSMSVCVCVQLCMTLLQPHGLWPDVHGIFQARTLEWVAISSPRGSSPPTDRTHVFCIDRQILYQCSTWEAQWVYVSLLKCYHVSLTFSNLCFHSMYVLKFFMS